MDILPFLSLVGRLGPFSTYHVCNSHTGLWKNVGSLYFMTLGGDCGLEGGAWSGGLILRNWRKQVGRNIHPEL